MFRTDADETKMLVEKLLDENEQRAMNLFRLILSSSCAVRFFRRQRIYNNADLRDHADMGMVLF